MTHRFYLLVIILITPFLTIAQSEKPAFKSYWDKGYILQSDDGSFKMKFGGRIQQDWTFFSQDRALDDLFGELENRSEFRRLRFYNAGTIYKSIGYKMQVSFGGGKVSLADVYIAMKGLPFVGNLKVGHFKEPFSLDMLTSSNDITFMERGAPTVFKKQRNSGVQFSNSVLKGRATWAIGLFQNADKSGKAFGEGDGYSLTGRVTALPFYDKAANKLLHLGFAYSNRNPPGRTYSVKVKPESHAATAYLNTGNISGVTSRTMFGFEMALVLNSLSFQGEYIQTNVLSSGLQPKFNGYYLEVGYFLTGEHKHYSTKSGIFKRVSPKRNFDPKGEQKGFGAVEVAVRYSSVDLNDKSIFGGVMDDVTFGLNWHLNPATRFSFNYIAANVREKGKSNIFQTRFQVAF